MLFDRDGSLLLFFYQRFGFAAVAGPSSFSVDAGEWLNYASPVWGDAALSILLTTSGESAELVELFKREEDQPLGLICNNAASTAGIWPRISCPSWRARNMATPPRRTPMRPRQRSLSPQKLSAGPGSRTRNMPPKFSPATWIPSSRYATIWMVLPWRRQY